MQKKLPGFLLDPCPFINDFKSMGWVEAGSNASIPYSVASIGLDKDEFAFLCFFILKSHNPDYPNTSWWGYRALQRQFKVGAALVRRITFILEHAGLVRIDHRKGKKNVYQYRHINPSDTETAKKCVNWAREWYYTLYKVDGRKKS